MAIIRCNSKKIYKSGIDPHATATGFTIQKKWTAKKDNSIIKYRIV